MLRIVQNLCIASAALIIAACSGGPEGIPDEYQVDVDWDAVASLDGPQVSWRTDVQPVLEKRCVVCHGCFDAPCQLKLTSYEGLMRGANPVKVYNGARIKVAQPTRLFIDAEGEAEWRAMGFHSVLADGPTGTQEDAADFMRDSVVYRMLRLKQLNPQPRTGLLPNKVTIDLDRKQTCTKQEDIAKFERDNPLWGMPYGMQNLTTSEYQALVRWLAQGAQGPEPSVIPAEVQEQIVAWERFLNGSSNKEKLVSRYLYEHLFLGHLYFSGNHQREFFRLVRSSTPPGEPVAEIATVRPFDDPGAAPFWYRLRHYDASIVSKSHVIYELSPARMARYQELFFGADYSVAELPGYELPDGANPFITFATMPPRSRYQFMLDDARFFIQGFMKGPVCRGQVALNVIEDQFWVTFVSPDRAYSEDTTEALVNVADYLQMPVSVGTFNLHAAYGEYWNKQKTYLREKSAFRDRNWPKTHEETLALIWDGGGTNPNAALTIFRNFDSAAVEFGLLGAMPETSWVIDFPLFERIHYLLVAGFDVYGNVGHQLNTRLFMDFLRMEGEDNFLSFLPQVDRQRIRASWYQGIRSKKRDKYFEEPMGWSSHVTTLRYTTDDPQTEFYGLILDHLGPLVAGGDDFINRCAGDDCSGRADPIANHADRVMRGIAQLRGEQLKVFPENSYVRVVVEGAPDFGYSLVHNRAWNNVTSFLENAAAADSERDPSMDTMTVLRRFSGAYPNFYFVVAYDELEDFVEIATAVRTIDDYHSFVARYGVRRTEIDFWEQADWFQEAVLAEQPIEGGILDLSRYENR